METSLISELRRRIRDVGHTSRAFGLAVTDDSVSDAIAEVTNGHLIVSVSGSVTIPSLDIDLSRPQYETIGRLHQALSRTPGYRCTLDEDANLSHPSVDLESFGPVPVHETGVDLKHHRWSDLELDSIIHRATQRHNPSLNSTTLPSQEVEFVLQLAQAIIYRDLAGDAVKRKGLDTDVDQCLKLANDHEAAYRSDTARLARAIQSPKEANSSTMDEGDVVLGRNFRRSMRTGLQSPLSQALPPDAAYLLEPDSRDAEDTNLRVNWQQNRNYDFYSYELWMDFRPEVIREREGLISPAVPYAFLPDTPSPLLGGVARETSSRMVFRSYGANSNFDTAAFATFVQELGQSIKAFIVGKLEPETTYYFRLYVVNLNYQAVASNIVQLTTKPLRAMFKTNNYADRLSGPAGTVITFTLESAMGAVTTSHRFLFGPKELPMTILTPYTFTVTVPAFSNLTEKKDLTLISPTGLIDCKKMAFMVTTS
jgi:hypothetical protein